MLQVGATGIEEVVTRIGVPEQEDSRVASITIGYERCCGTQNELKRLL
jgi:hypothetical protein